MRIDLHNTAAGQITNQESGKVSNKPVQHGGAPIEDTASLSTDSVSLSSLSTQAMQSPEVRQDRVDALRQAIGNGTYSVTPQQIADAIVRDHKK